MTVEELIEIPDPVDAFTSPLSDLEGILRQQRAWLDKLQEISRKPIHIKAKKEAPWIHYALGWSQLTTPVYARQPLENEIVFDPELKNWTLLKREMKKLTDFLDREHVPFFLSYNGSNGIHISIFLANVKLPEDITKAAGNFDINIGRVIRETLSDLIFERSEARKTELYPDKEHQLEMIVEYGYIRHDGYYKTEIAEIPGSRSIARRIPLKFPEKVMLWNPSRYIPEIVTALNTACTVAQNKQEYGPGESEIVSSPSDFAEILKAQHRWLCKLREHSSKPLLVKAKEGKIPEGENEELYRWSYFGDVWGHLKQPIWTRGILRNELLLDPDVKNWERLRVEMTKIKEFCKREDIPLYLAYTGGNGLHGDIFFDDIRIDNDNFEMAKSYEIDLFKIVRNILVDIILEGAGTNRTALALDPKKINFDKQRLGSQVREYGTIRPDKHGAIKADNGFKTLISKIPAERPLPGSLPLVFPDKVVLWKVPDKYNIRINEAIREKLSDAEKRMEYATESIDLSGNQLEKLPCIKRLFKIGTSKGKRYYGVSSIALAAKKCGYSWAATEESIKKFLSVCDITREDAQIRIANCRTLFDTNNWHFSCKVVKETFGTDICDFKNCALCDKAEKLRKESEAVNKEGRAPQYIIDKANELLDTGKALDFLMETAGSIHVGDETTIKATFGAIGCQSTNNSHGIQPKVSGGSGKGKTHAVQTVFHLVPPEFVKDTTLSGKALFHSNIKPGTAILSDDVDPDEDIEGIIKRSSTNFQRDTHHEISVKVGDVWTTKVLTIPPRIVWSLTSVNDDGSVEFLNRQFNLGVDESTEQDDKVWERLAEKAEKGEIDFPVNDNVLICREIIRDIKKHLFTVKIPFARRIIWTDKQNRRNGPQFMDFIIAFAVYNYRKRVKVDNNTILASEEDFYNAVSIYGQRAPNQKLKLNDAEIKTLMLMKVGEPYTLEKMQELTNLSNKQVYRLFHGRDKKGGLLEKVPDLKCMPETEVLGEHEFFESGGYERELTTIKKTRPRQVFILTRDYNSLLNFDRIATLQPESTK